MIWGAVASLCLATTSAWAADAEKPKGTDIPLSKESALIPDPEEAPPAKRESSEKTATVQPERHSESERALEHEPQKHDPERHRWMAVGFDVGVPDGLAVNIGFRPIRMLRIEAAALYNLGGFGIRGGLTFAPIDFVISPTLTFEVGNYFTGNFNKAQAMFTHQPIEGALGALLSNVQYTYGNLQLGVEIGSYRSVMFTLHFGLSYVSLRAPGSGQAVQEASGDPTLEFQDPKINFIIPSARLGLLVFFG